MASNLNVRVPKRDATWLVQFVSIELADRAEAIRDRKGWAAVHPENAALEAEGVEKLSRLLARLLRAAAKAELNTLKD